MHYIHFSLHALPCNSVTKCTVNLQNRSEVFGLKPFSLVEEWQKQTGFKSMIFVFFFFVPICSQAFRSWCKLMRACTAWVISLRLFKHLAISLRHQYELLLSLQDKLLHFCLTERSTALHSQIYLVLELHDSHLWWSREYFVVIQNIKPPANLYVNLWIARGKVGKYKSLRTLSV